MRVAILSDIHGNVHGLNSALAEIELREVDDIWCTGDFVNYGADPGPVMNWAMEAVSVAVLGNHDAVVVDRESPEYFNRYARQTIPYTKDSLTDRQYQWLHDLSYVKSRQNALLTHASPDSPEEWTYVIRSSQAARMFRYFDERVCFIGHSHVQGAFDSRGAQYSEGTIQLEDGVQYLVNSGSVGQPRDGDPRWGFSIYDSEAGTVELIRGEYDIDAAASRIIDEGLPEFLAYRLRQGR